MLRHATEQTQKKAGGAPHRAVRAARRRIVALPLMPRRGGGPLPDGPDAPAPTGTDDEEDAARIPVGPAASSWFG